MTLLSASTRSSLQALAVDGALTSAAFNAVGGTSWIPITVSGGSPSSDATFSIGALLTGYVNRMKMDAARQAMPDTTIYGAPWLWIAESAMPEVGMILISAADSSLVFLVAGAAADDYGYVLAPLETTRVPDMATVAARAGGFQVGLRIGAW